MPDQNTIQLDSPHLVPRLLISVRDQHEATAVESLPATIRKLIGVLDLKEPKHGSLGRVDRQTASSVLNLISPQTVCSAALGELIDDNAVRDAAELPAGFAFAKIGLAGAISIPNWQQRWQSLIAALPAGTKPVAVAYVDHQSCDAPNPADVCKLAYELGCRGVLLDTFDKSAGSFAVHIRASELDSLLQMIRQRQMFSVLAGSIDQQTLATAVAFGPSLIGVRGAVCRSGRTGDVSETSLKNFCQLFKAATEQASNA